MTISTKKTKKPSRKRSKWPVKITLSDNEIFEGEIKMTINYESFDHKAKLWKKVQYIYPDFTPQRLLYKILHIGMLFLTLEPKDDTSRCPTESSETKKQYIIMDKKTSDAKTPQSTLWTIDFTDKPGDNLLNYDKKGVEFTSAAITMIGSVLSRDSVTNSWHQVKYRFPDYIPKWLLHIILTKTMPFFLGNLEDFSRLIPKIKKIDQEKLDK